MRLQLSNINANNPKTKSRTNPNFPHINSAYFLFRHSFTYNCNIDPHCINCGTTSQQCAKCTTNYGFNNTIQNITSCLICQIGSCNNCSTDAYSCDQCSLGLGLTMSNTSGVIVYNCIACDINCISCPSNHTICTQCAVVSKIGLSSSIGKCIACTDTNCQICTNNITQCGQCGDLYGVDHADMLCYLCGGYCDRCWWNVSHCERCVAGYGPYLGVCGSCRVAGCVLCGTDATLCVGCGAGMGVNGTNTCVTCADILCSDCSTNYAVCTACSNGFGLNSTNYCSNCSDSFCLNCSMSISNCTQCIAGYTLVSGACAPCNNNCLTCSPGNLTMCTSCNFGLFLNVSTCVFCIPTGSCHQCQSLTTCAQCNMGTYLAANAMSCPVCSTLCTTCFLNSLYSSVQCTNCTTGNELNHDVPPLCWEICGDGVTATHPCDLPLGISYDGCTDFCSIQNNFTCQVNSHITLCSYNGTLDMTLFSMTKSKTNNQFSLKISVFPLLNVFQYMTDTQLKQIFGINNPNFVVNNVEYDSQNGVIVFNGEITGSIDAGENIEIDFNPSGNIKAQFYASVNSVSYIQFKYIVYYYSPYGLTLAKIVLYVLYALLALGWISFFLGIILRKLPGLQALFVLQFAWLTIVNLNCTLLLPFEQVHPLRYTTGYNLVLLPDDLPESASAPYLTEFGLSQHFFFDNYNITPFLLQTATLIFLLVTTIKLRRFVISRKDINVQLDRKQLKQEFESLVNRNEQAHQLLMCSCMTFITYFAFCSALYFKLGTVPNIGSIIVFTLDTLIIVFTFVRFYLDPCSFDYFRFSFYITQLAMNHYFIHAIVLIASTVALVIVPDIVFAPLIPPGLLLIYTLVYRPYKQLRQNVRSAFNMVVMCSLAGFRIYVQMIPKKNLANNSTMLYFMINFIVLLPLVVILSFLFALYSYYQEYKIQKQQQQLKKTRKGRYIDRTRKILLQLGIVSVNKQLQLLKQQTTFRQILPHNTNLHMTSNNLQQNYLRQQMLKIQYINKQKQKESKSKSIKLELPQNLESKLGEYKKYKVNMRDRIKAEKGEKKCEDNVVNNFCSLGQQFSIDHDFVEEMLESKQYKHKIEECAGKQQKLQSKQNNIANGQKKQQVFQLFAVSPTNKQIVQQVLIEQNKYINLRSAIEQVHQSMKQQKLQETELKKLMKQFNDIKL